MVVAGGVGAGFCATGAGVATLLLVGSSQPATRSNDVKQVLVRTDVKSRRGRDIAIGFLGVNGCEESGANFYLVMLA